VNTGSSEAQLLDDGAAELIVTDPPYYDAVQYGELSGLFRVWGKVLAPEREWTFEQRGEALPRHRSTAEYECALRMIFSEAARTLSEHGRMLLTYHGTDFRGWTALGRGLHDAGFSIVALGVGHSENEKDHAKRGRLAFTRDLVIECVKGRTGSPPVIVTKPRTAEQRELLAAGRAIAEQAAGGCSAMVTAFEAATKRIRTRRISVSEEQRE
jgi:adenine-specific DNA methylase